MLSKRLICAAFACSIVMAASSAPAQTYPNRPIRFLIPSAPGGSADVAARILVDHLSRALGQQVYIEHKPGASGTIGIEVAARSAPDGYTVLVAPDWVASNPHVYKTSIDPMRDLQAVIQLSRQPVALAVHPALGVNSLAELITLAKQQPGMGYALGGGRGNPQHITAEWFSRLADIRLEAVPYRGGGQAIQDLIAGHVKIGSLGSSPLIPHYRAGKLRLIAQSTAKRSPSLPEVPTYQEAGIKNLVIDQWIGIFVPAQTPPTISARLNAEINKALSDAAIRDRLMLQAQEPVGGSSEQFNRLVRADFEKYEKLVKELNIKAQ